MLYQDNIVNLLGLKDVIVKKIDSSEDSIDVYVEMIRHDHICPCCRNKTNMIHDYRMQVIKDTPAFGKKVYIHLRKRRYRCPFCGKRFFEENAFLPRYYRITKRKLAFIITNFRDTVTASHIAEENDISITTALRYFDLVDYGSYRLPEVLSIDEFKGNAGNEKYQCIITDAENHIVLDILPNRKSSDLIRYFLKFPRKQRLKVKYIVMDMSSLFLNVVSVCFPNAQIVADRYHVLRQAIWAMEAVRKNVQKHLSAPWRKFCKHSKRLLHKHPKYLTDEEKEKVRIILGLSGQLEYAYHLKNDFQELIKAPDSITGRKLLADWVYLAEIAGLPEFNACTKAVHNWSEQIINSFDVPYSNGYTEGCNNKIKVLKRVCFGVRNFRRFRNRILHCAA